MDWTGLPVYKSNWTCLRTGLQAGPCKIATDTVGQDSRAVTGGASRGKKPLLTELTDWQTASKQARRVGFRDLWHVREIRTSLRNNSALVAPVKLITYQYRSTNVLRKRTWAACGQAYR